MRGFKIAHGKLGKQLRTARARVAQLFEQRRDVPKRVEVRDLNERTVVKLATERKHLTDIIKMVAYQAESDLLALLRPHYARADQEGEPCCTSCSPLQAISASATASCTSPWLRSARRIARAPPRPSVGCSTRRRQSSPALACACASQCVRHRGSGLPSPARRSSAALPRLLPRLLSPRRTSVTHAELPRASTRIGHRQNEHPVPRYADAARLHTGRIASRRRWRCWLSPRRPRDFK